MPPAGGAAGRSRRRGARPGPPFRRTQAAWDSVSATATARWLRRLDEDAYAGALWRRPVVFVPVHLVLGALLGAVVGGAGVLVISPLWPVESVRPGPDGEPVTVSYDYSFLPILAALAGSVLGLVAGALLALRRWRRLSRL